jgi:hypothetical protein
MLVHEDVHDDDIERRLALISEHNLRMKLVFPGNTIDQHKMIRNINATKAKKADSLNNK